MRSWKTSRRWLSCAAATLVVALAALRCPAQEESVRPGVNDSFKDAEVERFIERFERDGREIYDKREKIVGALELGPGMNVADIGAGTGFFSRMFAKRVGTEGTVFAVEIEQNFLDHIEEKAREAGIENIRTVLGTDRSARLPKDSVDVVFVCDTYHHFEYPFSMLRSIHETLRADGRLVIVDFERIKGVTSDFSIEHVRCGKGTVTDEVKDSGFDFVREVPILDSQYVIVFRKRPHDFEG